MRVVTALVLFAAGIALVLGSDTAVRSNPTVVVPGNGAGYDPHARLLTEIRDELRGVREELKLMRAGTPVKASAEKKLAREQVMLRRCAGCHTPSRVDGGKDGGLILFADDESKVLTPLNPPAQAAVADRVKRNDGGIMPPKPRETLPPKERELFD